MANSITMFIGEAKQLHVATNKRSPSGY